VDKFAKWLAESETQQYEHESASYYQQAAMAAFSGSLNAIELIVQESSNQKQQYDAYQKHQAMVFAELARKHFRPNPRKFLEEVFQAKCMAVAASITADLWCK